MSKFIGFLIILGGLVGSYFAYQEYAEKQRDKHNHWADNIHALIREHSSSAGLDGKDDSWMSTDASFFRILGLMHEAEHHKYSVADTVKLATSGSGSGPGEARLIADMLLENHRLARQLGVYDDLSNMLRMERGEAPISQAKGWENEPLCIGYILSPVIAPEASRSFVNMVLMPKGICDMQTDDLTGITPELAKKWLTERIITPETHQAIIEGLAVKKF
jgi:hypothetical protein